MVCLNTYPLDSVSYAGIHCKKIAKTMAKGCKTRKKKENKK